MFTKRGLNYKFIRLAEGTGGEGGDSGKTDPPNDPPGEDPKPGDNGFPDNTAVKDMTAEEQAAYWKFQSRKNENRLKSSVPKKEFDKVQSELEKAKRSGLSESDRQIAEIRDKAIQEGYQKARDEALPKEVKSAIRISVPEEISDEDLANHLEYVDLSKFVDNGEVDADKVEKFAAGITPKEPRKPDRRGFGTYSSGDDRSNPTGNKHSVSSAQEAHRAKLAKKRR